MRLAASFLAAPAAAALSAAGVSVTAGPVAALPLLALAAPACGSPADARGPRDVVDAYATALEEGRYADAYALLSDEARAGLPLDAFVRLAKARPEETRELARALRRPASSPVVTAVVVSPEGEPLRLVLEPDGWKVDGHAIDLYGQATPEQAVRSFVRAYGRKRWDILLRFVPRALGEGLDEKKLAADWDGEQRAEMDRIVQALEASLAAARFEIVGDRATMSYGGGATLELVEEEGRWKIEELE
ncbi:MAG: hypothetical protein IT376_18810 [Polyangiaceae bacterium]|nr:hypothetical protein [Polyangiaceae bacterium]